MPGLIITVLGRHCLRSCVFFHLLIPDSLLLFIRLHGRPCDVSSMMGDGDVVNMSDSLARGLLAAGDGPATGQVYLVAVEVIGT